MAERRVDDRDGRTVIKEGEAWYTLDLVLVKHLDEDNDETVISASLDIAEKNAERTISVIAKDLLTTSTPEDVRGGSYYEQAAPKKRTRKSRSAAKPEQTELGAAIDKAQADVKAFDERTKGSDTLAAMHESIANGDLDGIDGISVVPMGDPAQLEAAIADAVGEPVESVTVETVSKGAADIPGSKAWAQAKADEAAAKGRERNAKAEEHEAVVMSDAPCPACGDDPCTCEGEPSLDDIEDAAFAEATGEE